MNKLNLFNLLDEWFLEFYAVDTNNQNKLYYFAGPCAQLVPDDNYHFAINITYNNDGKPLTSPSSAFVTINTLPNECHLKLISR